MNIFVSDINPWVCAKNLDDKRVVKMVLETAQILSTAINLNGGTGPYKTTHKGHPCVKWAAKTDENYEWLLRHFVALYTEYTKRYNKIHKCTDLSLNLLQGANVIPKGDLTPFPNCTTFKEIDNTIDAYQKYLIQKWENDKRNPKWTNAERPKFYGSK